MGVALDGDLPAAIDTLRGLVSAPDPARPAGTGSTRYNASPPGDSPGSEFRPDKRTERPDVLPYDDPFTPSTAPFKRLSAYDMVKADFTLEVAEKHAAPLGIGGAATAIHRRDLLRGHGGRPRRWNRLAFLPSVRARGSSMRAPGLAPRTFASPSTATEPRTGSSRATRTRAFAS